MFLTLTILEAILIITGLFCLHKGGPVILILVLFISIIDFVNENLFVIHGMRWWKIPANVFYNGYSFVEMAGWVIIFLLAFKKRVTKLYVIVLGTAIILYSLLEVFVINTIQDFHTLSFSLFCLYALFFSCLYLFKINRREYHSLINDPVFWIFAGATCYNALFLVNLITMLDPGYWQHSNALPIFHVLQSVALIIFYLLICVAFILFYYKRRMAITRLL